MNNTRVRRKFTKESLRAVIYKMDGVEFATDVVQVQEIVRPARLARPANLPAYVEGLIKRRGRITPIVDLRKRLGFPAPPPTPETCAIIVKLPVGPVGFVVDAAVELRWVRTRDFEAPSTVLARVDEVYIQGIAYLGNRVMIMLDLELLLSEEEQSKLEIENQDTDASRADRT